LLSELSPKRRCSLGTPDAALPATEELPSAAVVQKIGTGLDEYQLEGGAWLPAAPVIVNEDYDFATATALGPIGAGIAARKRMDQNQEVALDLRNVALDPYERERLDALRACGVHVYGVVWTKGSVRELRIVRDVFERKGEQLVVTTHSVATLPFDPTEPLTLSEVLESPSETH
jgi:hypothetical protein